LEIDRLNKRLICTYMYAVTGSETIPNHKTLMNWIYLQFSVFCH